LSPNWTYILKERNLFTPRIATAVSSQNISVYKFTLITDLYFSEEETCFAPTAATVVSSRFAYYSIIRYSLREDAT